MDLKKIITQNWISIPATIIAIVSLTYAVYAHRKSTYEREPIFWSDTTTQVLDADRISETPIKVIKREDNSEIISNLFITKFSFWNNGRKPIKKTHILEDLRITVDDPASEIIDFKILKTSRNLIDFQLMRDQTSPDRALIIDFRILEKNDGITGQVMYIGKSRSSLTISGAIEEVKAIEKKNQETQARVSEKKTAISFLIATAFGSISFIGLIIYIFISANRFRKKQEKKYPESTDKYKTPRSILIFVFSILIISCVGLFYCLSVLFLNLKIPQSILP